MNISFSKTNTWLMMCVYDQHILIQKKVKYFNMFGQNIDKIKVNWLLSAVTLTLDWNQKHIIGLRDFITKERKYNLSQNEEKKLHMYIYTYMY